MSSTRLEKKEYPAVGESVYQTTLQNGLKLYLIPKDDFNETYAMISTKFGSVDTCFTIGPSKDKKEYPAGIAHFWNTNYLRIRMEKIIYSTLFV